MDSRVLFLYGNDEYAIARRLRELRAVFTDATEAEMNSARLDARSMTEDQWVNAVNALPFMAKQRLVVLENPSGRFARKRSKAGPAGDGRGGSNSTPAPETGAENAAEARKKFLDSLGHMPPTTQLVITELVELRSKQDRVAAEKHWLATWLRKNGQAVEFLAQPAIEVMPDWIAKEARAQGGEIAGPAAKHLAELVGTDTRQAAQEVGKLLTYVNWSRPVTATDVDAVSPLTAAPDVFKMVEALATGNGKVAQQLLHRLLEFQDGFSTWGMIIRQFRHVLVAREVMDARGGEPQVTEALSEVEHRAIHPYVAQQAMKQARGFSMPKLEGIYHKLLEIDEDAKTGRMPLEVALDLLVAELAG